MIVYTMLHHWITAHCAGPTQHVLDLFISRVDAQGVQATCAVAQNYDAHRGTTSVTGKAKGAGAEAHQLFFCRFGLGSAGS